MARGRAAAAKGGPKGRPGQADVLGFIDETSGTHMPSSEYPVILSCLSTAKKRLEELM